jgi:type I restriction enzyme R subunit
LDYFISVSSEYPVIATTSKLLSTGVDCKMVKLIVLDQQIGSMTEFKQIIGRGTRLRENEGKTNFTVMDFRNVTRLFADPDWDGPIEMDPDYPIKSREAKTPVLPVDDTPPIVGDPITRPKPLVDKDGCQVMVVNKVVSVYDQVLNHDYADYKFFDFGRSTEGDGDYLNEGLISQKEGFGGRGVVYDTYEWRL